MEELFLQMIGEHQNIIHKVSRMYRNTKEDQEDLYQEIVFQLWKAFPQFRGESKVSTWMYRVALNTSLATFRKKKLVVSHMGDIPEQFHPTELNEPSENEERMYWVLQQLNDAEKAVIALYLEAYSYREIAHITGISETNIGVRINRIKNKLKTIIG